MSTSTIPSRTRSLRKPSDAGARNERSYASAQSEQPAAQTSRSSQSPSRLPVKPPTRITRSTPTSRPPSAAGSTTSNGAMQPPPPRANTSKPTTTGGLQRSSSTRRPSVSSVTSQVEPEPVKKDRSRPPITISRHIRNASATTFSAGNQPPQSYTRNGSTTPTSGHNQPPSGHSRNASTTLPSINNQTLPGRTRDTSTSGFSAANQPRPGHVRTRSTSTLINPTTNIPPLSNRNSMIEAKLPRSSSRNSFTESKAQPQVDQLRKPAFSTLQQHFSPAKSLAPKPHPAAFLAPPSPSKLPANIVISAETAKLQNELLQLHLLHKDAARVDQEWRASAKMKLGVRFQSVIDSNEDLVALEAQETGKINALALQEWREQGGVGWGLDEKVQTLGEVIAGAWNLGESGGRYARVVRRFERWLRKTQDILERQKHDEFMSETDDVIFLEELDQTWKDDCLMIGRKLELWTDQIQGLGQVDKGSSLGTVVEGCRDLVNGMLVELSVMSLIEADAIARETEWIKSMNDDVSDGDNDTLVAGAVWRAS